MNNQIWYFFLFGCNIVNLTDRNGVSPFRPERMRWSFRTRLSRIDDRWSGLTTDAMAFVGLVRSQAVSRFVARHSAPLKGSVSSIHLPGIRPFASLRPPGFLPRCPPWKDIPMTTTALFLPRHFSRTPAPRKEKHENIYTFPNILTFSRILATPIIAYLILHDKPYLATSLLLYAGMTDLIDGWIARQYNLKSVVGTVIDPMADKFLMITLTGALAYTSAVPSNFPSLPGDLSRVLFLH